MGKKIDLTPLREIMDSVNYYGHTYDECILVSIEKNDEKLIVKLICFDNIIDITDRVHITLDTPVGEINEIIKKSVDVDSLFTEDEKKYYSYVDVVDLIKEFKNLVIDKKLTESEITEIFMDPAIQEIDPIFPEHFKLFDMSQHSEDAYVIKMAKTPAVRLGLGRCFNYILKKYK